MDRRGSFVLPVAWLLAWGIANAQDSPVALDDVGRSAEQTLAVQDPMEAEARIRSALHTHGGYVSDRQAVHPDSGDRVTLGLRVWAASLDRFLDEVREVGRVLHDETRAKDPTPVYARIDSRLYALEAAELDLREQMSFVAPDAPLALDLEREVAAVRSERMATLAHRTLLDERVRYAVVRLTLLPEAAIRPASLAQEVVRAFASPWRDPAGTARQVLVVGLGLIVPYIGGLALLAWVVFRIARRLRRPYDRARDRMS